MATFELTCVVEDAFLQYKGSDWLGMTFGLISTYFLTKEKRSGFVYGIIGGVGWLAFGILTSSIASIVANLLFIGFNCRGYLRWKEKDENGERER